jgi:hypothetical protein
MNNNPFWTKRKLFAGFALLLGMIAFFLFLNRGTEIVNPATNKTDENPRAGKDYALVYNHGELYKVINFSDDRLRNIQQDLATYARATQTELKNPETLVGFTLDKGFQKKDNVYTFTGHYYSVKNLIKLVLTDYGKEVFRLSITDTKTGENIDESLYLNGAKNQLLAKLPIEKTNYSIRSLHPSDNIVVTFYKGYTRQDVDEAIGILREEYGDKFRESDFTYNLNGIGTFPLEKIIDNLTNPIPPR